MKEIPPVDEPFWMDEPNPYASSSSNPAKWSPTWWAWNLFLAFSLLVRLSILVLFVFVAREFPFMWVFVVLSAFLLLVRILFPLFKETQQAKAVRIQQQARESTRADMIGSALHTAGHPLLQANQPVVLALTDVELSIFGYGSSKALDTLPIRDIQSVDPIMFDDDHVPHIGPIDNAAQALQITFRWRGNLCKCSFRRMYKVRTIGWYQAIQRARLSRDALST